MVKRVEITPEVRAVLERGEWKGWLFVLPPGQLDRKLYDAVNKVLVALGGRWHRGHGGHMFSLDAKPAFVEALAVGSVVDQKRTMEQFFTPPELAERMVEELAIQPRHHLLEPSAGDGRLVDAALGRVGFVTMIEKDDDLAAALVVKFGRIHGLGGIWKADFLEWRPSAALPIDRVLMNPPFSGNQDIAHVRRAFDFLRPGGKLAAIMSPHFTFAQDRPSREFRELIGYPANGPIGTAPHECGPRVACNQADEQAGAVVDASVELLRAGTFKAEGTNVSAVLVLIDKAR